MATEALKSGPITNRDATPVVKNNSFLEGGIVRHGCGTVEMTTSSDAGSTYRMFQIPSSGKMISLRLYSDDVGTTATVDVGLYQTTANGGAVLSGGQALFASAVDINAAALNGVDILYEAATSTAQIDDIEKPIWVQLGLATDPGVMYDVTITVAVGPASAGGTLSLAGSYVN